MWFPFDLQIFAEDEAAQTVDTDVAESTEAEEEQQPIPEELEGLPEDAAREVMAEAAKLEEGEQPKEDDAKTEAKKAEEASIVENQAVPYGRFKQKVDESNALKAELESYKTKYGDLNAQPTPAPAPKAPQMQAVQYQQAQQGLPPINLTPDVMKQIDELKKQEALRMTGLSKEDMDSLEYMEDDDPRKQQYQFALKVAESNIVNQIQQARTEQARQAAAFIDAHNACVADYNAFAQKEMAAPDFQNVMQFATQDYFNTKNPVEQQAIANAYVRVERNTASPAEVMLIKNYFTEAKNAYHGQAKAKAKGSSNPMAKVQQAASFPRSQQVEGSSDNDTGVSVATLEKMLAEKPWDEIPKKYQELLMGS